MECPQTVQAIERLIAKLDDSSSRLDRFAEAVMMLANSVNALVIAITTPDGDEPGLNPEEDNRERYLDGRLVDDEDEGL